MTISSPMNEHAPCTRHDRHVWMASCADCTAWHLAALEDARARAAAPARARSSAA
jgi:hypothetical protein